VRVIASISSVTGLMTEWTGLPVLLKQLADVAIWRGDLTVVASLIAEADAVCEVTGARIPPYAALMLAAYRGREAEATQLIRATIDQATAVGQGATVTWAHWAAMRLYVASEVRPGGTLLFLGDACGDRATRGVAFSAALTAALSAVTRDLAREVAPVRVNLIVAGCAGALPGSTRRRPGRRGRLGRPPHDRHRRHRRDLRRRSQRLVAGWASLPRGPTPAYPALVSSQNVVPVPAP